MVSARTPVILAVFVGAFVAPSVIGIAEEIVGMPNPFIDFATLDEAEKSAGFELTVPPSNDAIFRFCGILQMIEVIYKEDGQEQFRIRKAIGAEDISGDYSLYKEVDEVTIGSITATLKGDDGKIFLAIWTDEKYSYAINIKNGLSRAEVINLVKSVK